MKNLLKKMVMTVVVLSLFPALTACHKNPLLSDDDTAEKTREVMQFLLLASNSDDTLCMNYYAYPNKIAPKLKTTEFKAKCNKWAEETYKILVKEEDIASNKITLDDVKDSEVWRKVVMEISK